MVEVSFSSSFKRAFKKRIGKNGFLSDRFWRKTEVFVQNPFERELKTHKLSGALDGMWSFSVDYDCRVIFYFKDENKAVFVDIGTHDEVY
jgi:proteic killer suppression protein